MSSTNSKAKRAPLTPQQKAKAFIAVKTQMAKGSTLKEAVEVAKVAIGGVNSSVALYHTMYRMLRANGKIKRDMYFDVFVEEVLVGFLEGCSLANQALSKNEFLECVRAIDSKYDDASFLGWHEHFMKRHESRLSVRTVMLMDPKRAQLQVSHSVTKFMNWIERWFMDNHISTSNPKNLFNADETRIAISLRNTKVKRIEAKIKHHNGFKMSRKEKYVTYIPFHNSENIIFQVIIFPIKCKAAIPEKKPYELRSCSPEMHYTFSETGWLVSEGWINILRKFRMVYDEKTGTINEPIFLLLDQLRIHLTLEALTTCQKFNIHVGVFPRHSTHLLQPADQQIFQALKGHLSRNFCRSILTGTEEEATPFINPFILNALGDINQIITKDILAFSWAKTGLVPFSPEKMQNLLNEQFVYANLESETKISSAALIETINIIRQRENAELVDIQHDDVDEYKLFDGDTIKQYKLEKSKNKKVKSSSKSNKKKDRGDESDTQTRPPKIMKKIDFRCSSKSHNSLTPGQIAKIDKEYKCHKCKVYFMCSACYIQNSTIFDNHTKFCRGNQIEIHEEGKQGGIQDYPHT